MTYMADGKQYIVIAISGGAYSGEYLAYALPDSGITAGSARFWQSASFRESHSRKDSVPSGTASTPATRPNAARPATTRSAHPATATPSPAANPRPLTGGEFLSSWNGLTVGDLFDRTRTTMPQNRPGSLSRQAGAEILAYIFSVNQFPPGRAELPQASEALREIRIDAFKPGGRP